MEDLISESLGEVKKLFVDIKKGHISKINDYFLDDKKDYISEITNCFFETVPPSLLADSKKILIEKQKFIPYYASKTFTGVAALVSLFIDNVGYQFIGLFILDVSSKKIVKLEKLSDENDFLLISENINKTGISNRYLMVKDYDDFDYSNNFIDTMFKDFFHESKSCCINVDLLNSTTQISDEFLRVFPASYGKKPIDKVLISENVVHPNDVPLLKSFFEKMTRGVFESKLIIKMHTFEKKYIYTKWSCEPFYDKKGRLINILIIVNNIDRVTQSFKRLKFMTNHDSLTGIYNMRYFYTKVKQTLEKNPDKNYALITFDLNKFKMINDLHGTVYGDNILKNIASALAFSLYEGSFYARFYSDIFAMLIPYISKAEVINTINTVTLEIEKLNPMDEIFISYGIYDIVDKTTDVQLMCDRSLLAKKRIKGNSAIRYCYYSEELRKTMINEKEIEDDMYKALYRQEFEMYLQPKHGLSENQVVGAEALVRWNHPTRGLLYPKDFISIFEKNGFIIHLDEFIWECACKTIRAWIDEGKTPLPISVNISRGHIINKSFIYTILGLIKKYEIPSNLLVLELTESLFVENTNDLYKSLNILQDKGFRLEMDDFGSGYSSLSMLKNVPVDAIKIDKSFLDETIQTDRGKTVIKHSIQMAKELNLYIIAEGVENSQQLTFLKDNNCDAVQGYFYAKPMPLKDFEINYIN